MRFPLQLARQYTPFNSAPHRCLGSVALACLLAFSLTGLALARSDSEWLDSANRYLEAQDYSMALRDYKTVLNGSPTNAQALVGMTRAYLALGKLSDAQTTINKGLKAHPTNPQLHYENGLLLEKQGNKTAAKKAFEQFVHFSGSSIPASPHIHIKLRTYGIRP